MDALELDSVLEERVSAATRPPFQELLERHGDKIYNFAYRLAGNAVDASDLTQEAFRRAFVHWDGYDVTKSFSGWVCRILHNVFVDAKRRSENKTTVSLDCSYNSESENSSYESVLRGPDLDPLDELVRQERGGAILQALAELPVELKTVVILCDIEGFSYEEISMTMGCPLGTVRSRLHQARIRLREKYRGKP